MQTLLLIPLISVFPSNLGAELPSHEGLLNHTCRQAKRTRTCSLPLFQCQILVGGRLLSLIDLMDFGAQGLSSQTKQSDPVCLLEF